MAHTHSVPRLCSRVETGPHSQRIDRLCPLPDEYERLRSVGFWMTPERGCSTATVANARNVVVIQR